MPKPKERIRPFVRVYMKYRCISVNLAAHDILGKPPYFDFLWNDENKLLFIASLWDVKKGCYPIPLRCHHSRRSEIRIQDETFFSGLMDKLCWQSGTAYKVFGDFMPKYNMISFRMADPIIMEGTNR